MHYLVSFLAKSLLFNLLGGLDFFLGDFFGFLVSSIIVVGPRLKVEIAEGYKQKL